MLDPLASTEGSWRNQLISDTEPVFAAIFGFEMVLKILAQGFASKPQAYLRDGWNVLDFVVTVFSLLALLPGLSAVSTLRIIRVIRPLRTVSVIPVRHPPTPLPPREMLLRLCRPRPRFVYLLSSAAARAPHLPAQLSLPDAQCASLTPTRV